MYVKLYYQVGVYNQGIVQYHSNVCENMVQLFESQLYKCNAFTPKHKLLYHLCSGACENCTYPDHLCTYVFQMLECF